jgi:hypothetical protein
LGQNPAMEVLRCDASLAERIGPRPYEVTLTSSIALAEGQGEAHAYVLYFGAGGEIGPHEAGFGQLLFAVRATVRSPEPTVNVSPFPRATSPSSVVARFTRRAATPG